MDLGDNYYMSGFEVSSNISFNTPVISHQNSFISVASCPASGINQMMCEYCKTKNHETLIKCIDEHCNRWFCNSDKVKGAGGSHIFLHLKKANHKVVDLHPLRQCKFGKIKCISCTSDKVFSLGILLDTRQIYCRMCFNSMRRDINDWKNLIHEKKFDNTLINYKTVQQNTSKKKGKGKGKGRELQKFTNRNKVFITVKEINKIERQYENDMNTEEFHNGENLTIYLAYPNIETFACIMKGLLKLNSNAEKLLNNKNQIKNIVFVLNTDTLTSGYFEGVDYGCKFTKNDSITLSTNKIDEWTAEGKITEVRDGKYFIQFDTKAQPSMKKVSLQVASEDSVFKRLSKGLKDFSAKTQDIDILHIILGQKTKARLDYYFKSQDYSIPRRKKLNTSQNKAVRRAMKYKFSIIQGPPGTGKTETIITIVYNIIMLWRKGQEYIERRRKMERIIAQEQTQINNIIDTVTEDFANSIKVGNSAVSKVMDVGDLLVEAFNNLRENEWLKIRSLDMQIQQKIKTIKSLSNEMNKLNVGVGRAGVSARRQDYMQEIRDLNIRIAKMRAEVTSIKKNITKQVDSTNRLLATINNTETEESEESYKNEILARQKERNKKNQEKKSRKNVNNRIQVKISIPVDDELERIYSTYNSDHKVLVCAASNTAVTLLKDRLLTRGIKALQIYARCKQMEYPDENSLHYLKEQYLKNNEEYNSKVFERQQIEKELEKLNNKQQSFMKNQLKQDSEALQKVILRIENGTEAGILNGCEVICCTCLTSHLGILRRFKFQHVIFDEATQALEAESLLCLSKGAAHAVLVGDIKQLGSVVQSPKALKFGLDVPLIERLIDLGVPQSLLSVQYRMHPMISQFSNETLYNNEIQNGVSAEERTHRDFAFPRPVENESTFFYDVASTEEFSGCGDSIINRYEAEAILDILQYMLKHGVEGDYIAIITFYDGQRGFLTTYLNSHLPYEFISKVEIMSVDASQGKEQEYVILSCVRSNRGGVGFLDEFRRLNVSMTRAKRGLIICGHIETLLGNRLWSKLLYFYAKRDLIVNGKFERLEKVEIELGEDADYVIERKKKYRRVEEDGPQFVTNESDIEAGGEFGDDDAHGSDFDRFSFD